VTGIRRFAGEASPPFLAAAAIIAFSEIFVKVTNQPAYILPAPSAVFKRLVDGFAPSTVIPSDALPIGLAYNAQVTLIEALLGLAMGVTLGVVLGVIMAHSRRIERLVYPIVVTIRSTPNIAIAPVFIIWFGFTIMPKAIVAMLTTFYPMLVNCITGMRSVDAQTLEFFRTVNASPREIFIHLRVHNTLPYFFAALRLSVSLSLIGAVVGELVGSRAGLGRLIAQASINLRTDEAFAGILVLAVMGIAMTELVSLVQGRVLFWHESQRAKT